MARSCRTLACTSPDITRTESSDSAEVLVAEELGTGVCWAWLARETGSSMLPNDKT